MFSHNGVNGRESKPRRFVQFARWRQSDVRNFVWSSSPDGGTGAKSAVSDCILLHVIMMRLLMAFGAVEE